MLFTSHNFFKGDFGYSYKSFPKTPIELISERLPRTLMLFAIVNIVSFYTGFFIGKILAWRRGSKSETWITLASVFSYTVFYPWFALMMLWVFGYKLGWLPIGKFLYPEKWYDAPFDSDIVFHVAADYRLWAKRTSEIYSSNVLGSENVALKVLELKKFLVYTSSVATLGIRNDKIY